jgi:AcrR family transcriptional regulator
MQKPEVTEDLRIRRTRKLLQQAFIELTVEKGFAALTVRDITERAMVNRSTFYRHYLDKYDLLEEYLNEIYELTASQDAPGPLNLLKHIQQLADFYRVMLGPKGDPLFVQRFLQNIEMRFRSFSPQALPGPGTDALPVDLRLSCVAYAGLGAITWWLEQEQPCSPDQIADWLVQISRAIAGPLHKSKR